MTAAEPIPFSARLNALAAAAPERAYVSMGGETRTRGAFAARSNRLARALRAEGVGVGDLVTIALPNGIAFLEMLAACWKIGATPQPVSSRLPRAELDAIAALAETRFVVGEAGLDAERALRTVEDLLARAADESPLPDAVAPSWKAPTSGGSTGRPKLILAGAPSLWMEGWQATWRIRGEDVCLIPGPLYHNGPLLTAAIGLLEGSHVVLTPRFDPEGVLAEIHARRASWLYLVPTMMSRIWRLPEETRARYDVSSLVTVWHLAAPCPGWLKRAWIDWLGAPVIWELYGATESIATTVITGAEWLDKPGSVGRTVTGEIVAFGPDGQPLAAGETGELFMRRSPDLPISYVYRGAETKALEGGWETVGDIGYVDADGYVFLGDRRSDMILVGGANIYPAEIEAALEEHPSVQSCAVIGLPDDDLGNRIHAIVQPRAPVEPQALLAHLAERLVRYKVPRSVEFVDFSVRDDAGKVRRSQLRAERMGAG